MEDRVRPERVVVNVLRLKNFDALRIERGVLAKPEDAGKVKLHLWTEDVFSLHEIEDVRDRACRENVVEVILIHLRLGPLDLEGGGRSLGNDHSVDGDICREMPEHSCFREVEVIHELHCREGSQAEVV